jgi:hypothetical protein
MRTAPLAIVLILVSTLVGCAKKDRPLSTFKPDRPIPQTSTAGDPGTYLLYAANAPDHPVATMTLVRRARFGFRTSGGQVVAFAQRQNTTAGRPILEDVEIPLPGGDRTEYYWMYKSPKE